MKTAFFLLALPLVLGYNKKIRLSEKPEVIFYAVYHATRKNRMECHT